MLRNDSPSSAKTNSSETNIEMPQEEKPMKRNPVISGKIRFLILGAMGMVSFGWYYLTSVYIHKIAFIVSIIRPPYLYSSKKYFYTLIILKGTKNHKHIFQYVFLSIFNSQSYCPTNFWLDRR